MSRINPETTLQNQMREALGYEGAPVVLWRLNQGSFRGADGATRFYGLVPGASDLLGMCRETGRFVAMEVKTKTGRLSDDQRAFLRLVNILGGYACVVRTIDDAIVAATRAARGDAAPGVE